MKILLRLTQAVGVAVMVYLLIQAGVLLLRATPL